MTFGVWWLKQSEKLLDRGAVTGEVVINSNRCNQDFVGSVDAISALSRACEHGSGKKSGATSALERCQYNNCLQNRHFFRSCRSLGSSKLWVDQKAALNNEKINGRTEVAEVVPQCRTNHGLFTICKYANQNDGGTDQQDGEGQA